MDPTDALSDSAWLLGNHRVDSGEPFWDGHGSAEQLISVNSRADVTVDRFDALLAPLLSRSEPFSSMGWRRGISLLAAG